MSGRDLTSFGPTTTPSSAPSDPHGVDPGNETRRDKAQYIPDSTDLIYHALQAEYNIETVLPSIFTSPLAVDNARFAGEGACFSVYRRHIPPSKHQDQVWDSGEGWTATMSHARKTYDVVAYKVPRVEFDELGRPSQSTKHAMRATVMELYLTSNKALVKHKNIVDFVDLAWGTNPYNAFHPTPVLVVEFSELGSLSHVLRWQYVPLSTRCKLGLDVCSGVQALHECNVVHGDLKTDNILVFSDATEGLVAKVSDFGYSHVLESDEAYFGIGGTRPWQAPETHSVVPRDNAKATDVYSLSLLVWCILAHGLSVWEISNHTLSSSEERYQAYEAAKISGQLRTLTSPTHWYLQVIETLVKRGTHPDLTWGTDHADRLKSQLGQMGKRNDAMATLEEVEKLAFMLHSSAPRILPSVIDVMGKNGVWPKLSEAISLGLSLDPSERQVSAIERSLGGSPSVSSPTAMITAAPWKHIFQWTDWPRLQPWLQHYLSTIIDRRRVTEFTRNMINPPEALLLAVLYTDGYGLPQDHKKAIEWMGRAMRANLNTASAYSYRHLTGLGFALDDAKSAVPTLEHMAFRGSRTALEDIKEIWPEKYLETRQKLRDNLAGVGADFFFKTEMLGNNQLGMWQSTFRDIDTTMPLFERFNNLATYSVNKRGDGVLHMAASCGFPVAIEALLKRFAPDLGVNSLNNHGETPLLSACRAGQLKAALMLLEQGADASIAAANGETPLHWAISFDETEVLEIIPPLLKGGGVVSRRTTSVVAYCVNLQSGFRPDRHAVGFPVAWATECNRPDIVRMLLEHTDDPTICAQEWPQANSALAIGASFQHAECLQLMIDAILSFNKAQQRPLYGGFLVTELLKQLVFHSHLFNLCVLHGAHWKVRFRETMRLLIPMSNLASSLQGYDGQGSNLLYWAVSLGRDEVVDYLLEDAWADMAAREHFDADKILGSSLGAYKPTDVNRPCGPDDTTPFLEAVRWGRMSMMKKLLAHGATATSAARNPFDGAPSTWTAMHIIAQAGHSDPELIEFVHSQGVPIDRLDAEQTATETPLMLAVQNDKTQLAEQLVSLGADPSALTLSFALQTLAHPTTMLGHIVALNARNSLPRIRLLFVHGSFASRVNPVVEPARQWTALHRAAAGHLGVRFRDTQSSQGMDLRWADVDWDSNAEIMTELLVRLGAHVDAVEVEGGNTALHLAVLAGNIGAVRLFVERGVRMDVVNADGESASMLALRLWAETLSLVEREDRLDAEQMARRECADVLATDIM